MKSFQISSATVLILLMGVFGVTQFPASAWISNITNNYLPIHMILEFIGILVSFAVFTVGWATYQNVRSTDILLLSIISFTVGWLDLGHTLSFTGMPDFVTPSGPNKAIDFWLVSRLTGACGFLLVSLSKPRDLKAVWIRPAMIAGALLWTSGWTWTILFYPQILPTMFIPGEGLTPLKVILEWFELLISALAGVFFFRQGFKKNIFSFHWMGCACFIFAMSGFFFTLYRDFDDLYNFAGHIYKALGFIFVYRAVFVECISKPYEEARRLAKEASEASLSKSRFLANVSHEFRTPLGVISGFSDMLLESPKIEAEERKWTETISRNSRQLGVLIDDLLDLAKAENEKISVQWSTFSAVEVIEDVINSLNLQAAKKEIDLIFQTQLPKSYLVTSDQARFRQILINLINNAVKFTPKGKVRVFLRSPSPEKIEVSIEDSGIGIAPNQATGLFQPFAQADNPASRRFGGTGLGLALSKKLTGLLGGDLWLQKSEPDRGSVFTFTVAHQKEVPLKPAPESQPPLKQIDFSGRKILAAEDSPDNQSLLRHFLRPTGVELTFANNGIEAVALAMNKEFDLILMDIQMPEMDGFEAVLRLRDQNWKGPIIALSAHAHQAERERALKGGFNDYLVKPISRDKLWKGLANFMSPKGE